MSSFTYAFIHITAWTVSKKTNEQKENDEWGLTGIADLKKEEEEVKGQTLSMYSDHKHLILFIFYNHHDVS